MSLTKLTAILVLSITSTLLTLAQSSDNGHVSILVSQTGLEFAKDILINKMISTTIPLHLPDIEKKVDIPIIGRVQMGLTNIQLYAANAHSSAIATGQDGKIILSVSGSTADLSMDWAYNYKASFFKISDHGIASVNVKGMDVKISITLVADDGCLKIVSRDSYCTVKSISIHVNGGASWLYQGVVDAFEKRIISTVEDSVSSEIVEKLSKLDSFLQSLPKEKKIDNSLALNLSFTRNPVLGGDSSIGIEINGLFIPNGNVVKQVSQYRSSLFPAVKRMVTISIEEEVFNSGTFVYFNAKRMHVVIDETKNGSVLSTSDWKFILPALYKLYPDVKMMLNMSVISPPIVDITGTDIDTTLNTEISINVQKSGAIISVARISSVLNVACLTEIAENNLVGSLKLKNFNATMKWNKLGDLQANYIQAATSKVLEALFLPYINTRLKRGFPLPFLNGFKIKNTEIMYVENRVMLCSDIASYEGSLDHYY